MVEYGSAIKRPFQDLKTLAIGSLLYMIPLLNIITGLFATGYILDSVRNVFQKNYDLPAWEEWGKMFIEGLFAAIIYLIYALPAIIVMLIFGREIFTMALTGGMMPMGVGGFFGAGMVVAMLLYLAAAFLAPVAVLRYIDHESFGEAFAFGEIFKAVFTGTYISAWLVVLVYSVAVGIVAALLNMLLAITVIGPVIVAGIMAWVLAMTGLTMLADAYAEVTE